MRLRRVPLVLKNTLFLPHFSPKLPPNHPQNVPQFSPFQGDALAEKSLNLSPFTAGGARGGGGGGGGVGA